MQKGAVDLTESELKNLTSAMKKPEFRELLNQYIDEISDPKNKAETDAYLQQLEAGGELPPGRVLILPQANFCIKTQGKGERGRSFKIFINLCMSDKIPQPTQQRRAEGVNWSLPYAVGQPRHDQDTQGQPCITIDSAFHPMAFQVADSSSKFKQLMCETAISGANTLLKRQGDKASSDYKILKNKRCKGGSPGSILAAQASLDNPDGAPKQSQERTYSLSEEGPKLYRDMIAAQLKDTPKEPILPDTTEEEAQEEPEKHEGVKAPKYKLVHSTPVGYSDCIDTREKSFKRPTELRVEIQVPLLHKLSDASIDLQPRLMFFGLKDVYHLELRLPYEVEEAKASAKFDRKKQVLTVRLPVVPAVEPAKPIETAVESLQPVEAEAIEEVRVKDPEPLWKQIEEVENRVNPKETEAMPTELLYKPEDDLAEEPKPAIEELSDNPVEPETIEDSIKTSEALPLDIQENVFPEYTFKQTPGSKLAYILFHVPGLIKSSVTSLIYPDEVEVKFTAKIGTKLVCYAFRIRLFKPVQIADSSVDKVIDYVSLKITKQEEENWPEAGSIIDALTHTSPPQAITPEVEAPPPTIKAATRVCIDLRCPLIYDLY